MKTIQSNSKPVYYLLVILSCFFLLSFVYSQDITGGPLITEQMANAFDAAVQEVIADTDFQKAYSELMFFPVPQCTDKKAEWPAKNPFASRSNIKLCLELGTLYPWLDIKKKVGEFVIKKINAKYSSTFTPSFKQYNTSAMGYFDTLKHLVDSGECDFISSNATPLPERVVKAHFQCSYGTGSNGFLRSGRNSSITISDISQLNSPDMIVGAYDGTSYSTYVKNNLPKAKFIGFPSASSSYQGVIDQSVHVIIGDAIQYRNWLPLNNQSCVGCSVSLFGDSYGFATFVTNNFTKSAANSVSLNILLICFIASFMISLIF